MPESWHFPLPSNIKKHRYLSKLVIYITCNSHAWWIDTYSTKLFALYNYYLFFTPSMKSGMFSTLPISFSILSTAYVPKQKCKLIKYHQKETHDEFKISSNRCMNRDSYHNLHIFQIIVLPDYDVECYCILPHLHHHEEDHRAPQQHRQELYTHQHHCGYNTRILQEMYYNQIIWTSCFTKMSQTLMLNVGQQQ